MKAGGTSQISRLAYVVDAVQNITNLSEQHAASDTTYGYIFGYDGADRLRLGDYPAAYGLPADQRYAYDPAGNRDDADSSFVTLGTHAYDANNRITASPGFASYAFDDDGNLTARTGEAFIYDATNRLRAFSKSGTFATYAYDPFGQRIQKTVNGVTTWYVWDGDQLLAEYDGSGARKVRYAYAGGFAPSQVAYKNGSSEDVYDVHTDHLDTPRLLTDEVGIPVWRASYEAFGETHVSLDPDGSRVTPDPGIKFHVRFPGQYEDNESGLHYNFYRVYDPGSGRYLSADPLGQRARTNVYEYALNNPQNFFDPFGLFGTNSCGYYDQTCSANGGAYECRVAPELCRAFPDDDSSPDSPDPIGNVSACMRQCLQERHQAGMHEPDTCSEDNQVDPFDENAYDHAACAIGCGGNPENPYDPTGPPLPDRDLSLY